MSTQCRLLTTVGALGIAVVLSGAVRADTATPTGATPDGGGPGIWQQHKYTFNFMGFTTIYSCDGLEDKLKLLLKLSGAGPGTQVMASCARGDGMPDKLAMAYLTFSSLQPATSPAALNAGPEGAPGSWRHVALSPRHPNQLELGDCELIEEFRDRVLPLFTTRNISNDVTCVPHQISGSNYRLSYDVFASPAATK